MLIDVLRIKYALTNLIKLAALYKKLLFFAKTELYLFEENIDYAITTVSYSCFYLFISKCL